MEMCFMSEDVASHMMTVWGVKFEVSTNVIAELLEIHRVDKTGEITPTTQARCIVATQHGDTGVELAASTGTPDSNVGTLASYTSPIQAEDTEHELEDDDRD